MNKERRKRLAKAGPMISAALASLAEARALVAEIRDEEAEAYDSLSDGTRDADQGQDMQAAIDEMTTLVDGLDVLDLTALVASLETVSDTSTGIETASPRLSAADADKRRLDRLPNWARETMDRMKAEVAAIEASMKGLFGKRTEDPAEIVIADYDSPMRDRVIPARRVAFPAFGITVHVDRGRKGPAVTITGERPLIIIPNVSNSFTVRPDEH